MTASSVIGDGDCTAAQVAGSGDFDFFAFTATAGQLLDANTAGSDFDTVLELYDADGNFIAFDDDSGGDLTSHLLFAIPADGNYYLMVGGFGTFPQDPFDPASGIGAGDEGSYDVEIIVNESDTDFYAVNLKAGDVIGGSLSGGATQRADVAIRRRGGGRFDPGRVVHLPERLAAPRRRERGIRLRRRGTRVVRSLGLLGVGTVRRYCSRPIDRARRGERVAQTIYLDFDGARLNTNIFGGPGVRTLSPLSSFLAGWGLRRARKTR